MSVPKSLVAVQPHSRWSLSKLSFGQSTLQQITEFVSMFGKHPRGFVDAGQKGTPAPAAVLAVLADSSLLLALPPPLSCVVVDV